MSRQQEEARLFAEKVKEKGIATTGDLNPTMRNYIAMNIGHGEYATIYVDGVVVWMMKDWLKEMVSHG